MVAGSGYSRLFVDVLPARAGVFGRDIIVFGIVVDCRFQLFVGLGIGCLIRCFRVLPGRSIAMVIYSMSWYWDVCGG